MDGRGLPQDPNPTWNGYSTGTWDGDTLVAGRSDLKNALWLDANGNPLTEEGKMLERISRPNFGTLRIEITIDDPRAHTKPWSVTLNQPLILDSKLLDYYCLENERDAAHMSGRSAAGGDSHSRRPTRSFRLLIQAVLRIGHNGGPI